MDEPMSARSFARKLLGNKEPDIDVDKELAPQYATLISTRDRAILEAAAERVCKACDEHSVCECPGDCADKRAILEPITKEKLSKQ